MNKMNKEQMIDTIENEILEVANLYNECTTSDLQGIATAKAHRIYELINDAE